MSALRTTRLLLVTPAEMDVLTRIANEQPGQLSRESPAEADAELELSGIHFRVGDRRGFAFRRNRVDEEEILASVHEAKQRAAFVILSVHAHEPGNWSEEPAQFLVELAHLAIDAGADAVVGHGPHRLRGIEVYKDRPIFYSLGNFIFQLDLLRPIGCDLLKQYRLDVGASEAEWNALWAAASFSGDVWYRSVVATTRFKDGRADEISLVPLDLQPSVGNSSRGAPRLAAGELADAILEDLRRLSRPFGTRVTIGEGRGVVRP